MEFNQEQIMKIQMLEQESQQLNQQLQALDQHIQEMNQIKESFGSLKGENTKELLTNIGKKIYLPVTRAADHLVVDIGNNYFLKKSVHDAEKIVEEQLGHLAHGKGEVLERLEGLQGEVETLLQTIEMKDVKK